LKRLIGYLRLMRLANIVTAVSDILAGIAIAGSLTSFIFPDIPNGTSLGDTLIDLHTLPVLMPILYLVLATICLYGGGVVLNDVFDAKLDLKERPERPIPSGLISKSSAAILGWLLLLAGIVFAALTDPNTPFTASAYLAIGIAVASVVYDRWSKHNKFFGPLNMGLCRGLNLALGMSIINYSLNVYWPITLLPVVYIAAITLISRGEVHGGRKPTLYFAAALYLLVVAVLLGISGNNGTFMNTLPFIIIFSILIFPSLQKAIRKPEGPMIGKAVKSGVIALIAMNASWAAAFGDIYFAVLILLLLPLSLLLARLFAVT
jgi:4-hydroxybenzoate polyprenyltransferase